MRAGRGRGAPCTLGSGGLGGGAGRGAGIRCACGLYADRAPGPACGGCSGPSAGTATPAAGRARPSSRATATLPAVFVLEYYLDTLWKGTLLFVVCLLLVSFGVVSQV